MKSFELLNNIIKNLDNNNIVCCNYYGSKYLCSIITTPNIVLTKKQYKYFNNTLEEYKKIYQEYKKTNNKFKYILIYKDKDDLKYKLYPTIEFSTDGFKKIFEYKNKTSLIKIYQCNY